MNTELTNRVFVLVLAGIIVLQVLAGLWHIDYPFVDGRQHYNWGPAFWAMQAEEINEVGLPATYFGLKDYASHPQLIGPVLAGWTGAFGYGEASMRFLALSLTVLATILLAYAVRSFIGNRGAIAFTLLFSALPMIYIYGRKLDQETLLLIFLALHLWGIGLLNKSNTKGLILVGIGSLGMMLSDWSGAVLTLATGIGALVAWNWREHMKRLLMFIVVSFGASGIGLLLFLLQSYLQSGLSTVGEFIGRYIQLWEYRAGLAKEGLTWGDWAGKQWAFLSANFNIFVFLAGVWGLVLSLGKKVESGERALGIFAAALFLGSLAYMLAVPQASSVHIYFQYYLAIPIALGLVFIASKACKSATSFSLAIAGLFIVLALLSASQFYKTLFVEGWGDPSDIELLKTLRDVPPQETVIVIGPVASDLEWFKNPNMRYYLRRDITAYYTADEGINIADHMVVFSDLRDPLLKGINELQAFGRVRAETAGCSKNLCLLTLN